MPSFVALDPQKEIRDPEDGSQINPPGFCLFFLPFQDDLRYVFYKYFFLLKVSKFRKQIMVPKLLPKKTKLTILEDYYFKVNTKESLSSCKKNIDSLFVWFVIP